MENIPDSLERTHALLRALGDCDIAADTDAVMQSVRAQIRQEPSSSPHPHPHPHPYAHVPTGTELPRFATRNRRFNRIATRRFVAGTTLAATLVLMAAFFISKVSSGPEVLDLASITYREYATRNGQRAAVDLPDGTHVVLNAGSRIRISESFGTRVRAVYLEGEAQFTVSHDRARPFLVHAQGTIVKDLATVFAVRGFPGEGKTRVYVAAGAVAVDAGALVTTPTAVLEAGDLATVVAGMPIQLDRDVSPSIPMGWVYGRLVFHDMPLHEVLRDLGRWFDLTFVLADPALSTRRITTQVSEGSSSQEVLDGLADVLDVRIERVGKTVTLVPRS